MDANTAPCSGIAEEAVRGEGVLYVGLRGFKMPFRSAAPAVR